MTQERGFHINPRNWTIDPSSADYEIGVMPKNRKTDVKEGILLILFEFVGTENLQTTLSFLSSEAFITALKEGKDILNNDCL
jgi:hypothetical protein